MEKNPWNRGLSDKLRDPPYLDPGEADFIVKQRALGRTDAAIAKMMRCSIERIRRFVVADLVEPLPQAPVESTFKAKVPYINAEERSRRNREARQVRNWRAPPRRKPEHA